jgi:hypothetical protein
MTLTPRRIGIFVVLGLVGVAGLARAQQTEASFHWTGRIAPGNWIRVQNLNGGIIVGASGGDNVEVTATKHWRRGDPSVVRFETKKYGPGDENVMICALWGERSSCGSRGYDSNDDDRRTRDNDVSVEFRVLVPKGVKVAVNTVNGAVSVEGATSDVDAETVNGELAVNTTGGHVNASNVNGGVRATLGHVDGDGSMRFKTVNGSVTLDVPADFGADVEMATVNGSLNTNFEMTLTGRMDPHRLRTHVGRPGGPRIRLETVNGDVDLRRQ